MAYSFYGGKQGRTYKLVHHYDSIKQMVDAFQQGGSYNEVNYGQYVIIDTVANNHQLTNPQNGIIYRRGLNYTESFNPNGLPVNENGAIGKEDVDENNQKRYYIVTTDEDDNQLYTFDDQTYYSNFSTFVQNPGGGAEYVGQIVGPQGQSPQLSILKWEEFLEKYQDPAAANLHKDSYEVNPPAGAQFDENGDVIEQSIIDVMQYGYLDIKDEYGNIIGSYIAIDFPHSVFKYHAESIEPYDQGYAAYDEQERVWKYTNLISEDEISQDHPFFWQYDIKVPKGVRGQDLEESGIEIDPSLISEDGNDILPGPDDNNYRYYNIYRNYQLSAEGETTKEYLDSWQRTIHRITNNGTFPDFSTIERDTTYDAGERVYADGLSNHLCLLATTAGTTSSEDLPSLANYEVGRTFEDGTITWRVVEDTVVPPSLLTVHYTHGSNDEVKIRVLDHIFCNAQDGRMYAKYSDLDTLIYLGENQSIIGVDYVDTPWIDPNGIPHVIDRLCIRYNTYNYDQNGRIVTDPYFSLDSEDNLVFPTTDLSGRRIQYIDEQFKFLERVETDPLTKVVIAYYNDGTQTTLGDLRSIGRVFTQNEGDLGKATYFAVEYNNQLPDGTYQTERFGENPLNEVAAIQQYGDNIIVLYSDPATRQRLYRPGTDYAIVNTAYDIPNYDKTTGDDDGNGNLYWINLGAIYKSNHIFSSFSSLSQLQQQYPYGFDKDTSGNPVANMQNFAGWLATVADGQNTTTYAYDYRGSLGWYRLQDLSTMSTDPTQILLISQPDSTDTTKPPLAKDMLLNNNGYWFVVSERAD